MSKDNKTLESLIAGGAIGAALGALLSKDKEDGAILGALLGAAIFGTLKANEEAQKTNQPVMIAEDGKLYEILPDGQKRFVKDLPKPKGQWPDRTKLK